MGGRRQGAESDSQLARRAVLPLLDMETLTAVGAVVAACTGLVAAVASVWNAYQFSLLKGRGDAVEKLTTAHVNAAGLHN